MRRSFGFVFVLAACVTPYDSGASAPACVAPDDPRLGDACDPRAPVEGIRCMATDQTGIPVAFLDEGCACAPLTDACAPGTHCVVSPSGPTCQPVECARSADCRKHATDDYASVCVDGTCVTVIR